MYLHEYQAKELLAEYGAIVPASAVVASLHEVDEVPFHSAVIKIQVHAGGRGKAGGIAFAKTTEEIRQQAEKLLGMRFVTKQTPPSGVVAERLLIEQPIAFTKEYYLAILVDRKEACVTVMASPHGGMEIEELARKYPEAIITERVADSGQLHHFQLERLARFLSLTEKTKFLSLVETLFKAFFHLDALLIEINPLVQDAEGDFVVLDAKMQIDENALFREARIASMWDPGQYSVQEQKARELGLSYIALDGNIGCMVNGAGLALATMDLIQFWGGKAANFLDVGGGASEDKVREGFLLLFSDPRVKVVLVNIFGGIMNCETIAQAILKTSFSLPLIVRLEGTNVQEAKNLLNSSGRPILFVQSLDEAARAAVEKACQS